MKYLLDTHALIWLFGDTSSLGTDAAEVLRQTPDNQVAISQISFLEVSMAHQRQRIFLNRPLQEVLEEAEARFFALPINSSTALLAPRLQLPQGDPFDRVIVATALVHRLTLVTKDRQITAAQVVPVLW